MFSNHVLRNLYKIFKPPTYHRYLYSPLVVHCLYHSAESHLKHKCHSIFVTLICNFFYKSSFDPLRSNPKLKNILKNKNQMSSSYTVYTKRKTFWALTEVKNQNRKKFKSLSFKRMFTLLSHNLNLNIKCKQFQVFKSETVNAPLLPPLFCRGSHSRSSPRKRGPTAPRGSAATIWSHRHTSRSHYLQQKYRRH